MADTITSSKLNMVCRQKSKRTKIKHFTNVLKSIFLITPQHSKQCQTANMSCLINKCSQSSSCNPTLTHSSVITQHVMIHVRINGLHNLWDLSSLINHSLFNPGRVNHIICRSFKDSATDKISCIVRNNETEEFDLITQETYGEVKIVLVVGRWWCECSARYGFGWLVLGGGCGGVVWWRSCYRVWRLGDVALRDLLVFSCEYGGDGCWLFCFDCVLTRGGGSVRAAGSSRGLRPTPGLAGLPGL